MTGTMSTLKRMALQVDKARWHRAGRYAQQGRRHRTVGMVLPARVDPMVRRGMSVVAGNRARVTVPLSISHRAINYAQVNGSTAMAGELSTIVTALAAVGSWDILRQSPRFTSKQVNRMRHKYNKHMRRISGVG